MATSEVTFTRRSGGIGSSARADHGDGCRHAVQFYQSEAYLCDTVARFLADGLTVGQPLIVLATAVHQDEFASRLRAGGYDVERACGSGQLRFHDARTGLDSFMIGSMPDEERFRSCIGGLIESSLRDDRRRAGVRAYGEMVDLLWRDGNPAAAIRVEELWNALAETGSFTLLCAYAMGNFYRATDAERFQEICQQHDHVIPAEGDAEADVGRGQAVEIALLQQRALALESEIEHRKSLEVALRDALAERRRTEEKLREAKQEAERASQVKSDFLAVMSHELRTPLNAIMGYEDLLAHEVSGPVTPTQKAHLARIRSAAEHLLSLVDQVLSLSRIEAGKQDLAWDTVDLVGVTSDVTSLIEPAAVEKGLDLIVRLPANPMWCHADAAKLKQILLNLLSNAVKFTSRGSVELHLRVENDDVVFEVKDTGTGIQPADHERIFERFVQVDPSATRSHGGTGLGLSVSRNLARLMGGDVTVTSACNAGSIFTLRLPAVQPALYIGAVKQHA